MMINVNAQPNQTLPRAATPAGGGRRHSTAPDGPEADLLVGIPTIKAVPYPKKRVVRAVEFVQSGGLGVIMIGNGDRWEQTECGYRRHPSAGPASLRLKGRPDFDGFFPCPQKLI
jgi:hypothetical protein